MRDALGAGGLAQRIEQAVGRVVPAIEVPGVLPSDMQSFALLPLQPEPAVADGST